MNYTEHFPKCAAQDKQIAPNNFSTQSPLDRVYYLALPKPAQAVRKAVKATMAEDRIRVLDLDDIETLAAELSVRANTA